MSIEFWTTLLERPLAKNTRFASVHPPGSPATHYIQVSAGIPGVWYQITARIGHRRSGPGLYIDLGKGHESRNIEVFNTLAAQRSAIEAEYERALWWHEVSAKDGGEIRARYIEDDSVVGLRTAPPTEWPAFCDVLLDKVLVMEQVFQRRLDIMAR